MSRRTRAGWLAVIFGGAMATVVVASVLPGPYAAVVAEPAGAAFLQSAQLDPADVATLQRSCGDCHSHDTAWPWYGRIAPSSWLLQKDVRDGRAFLNFSRWPEYGVNGQGQLLARAAEDLASGTMPPRRYLWLHPTASLTESEGRRLREALTRESTRVLASAPATSAR